MSRPPDPVGPAFAPPPYPYDRLAVVARQAVGPASGTIGGLVDCSVGHARATRRPPAVVEALAVVGHRTGLPGLDRLAPAYREAAAGWLAPALRGDRRPGTELAACVGTKEFVASTAQYLHLRDPARDTVLYPAVSYPTYAMGATLAGCRAVPVPGAADGGGPDLAAVDPDDAERALLLWTNSPSNPTGRSDRPGGGGGLGSAARGAGALRRVLRRVHLGRPAPDRPRPPGSEGVVAVHSLSKRSNLAGVRAGFYAGDPDLVGYLLDVRRHAGLMVPGPVQAAAAVALADDVHVDEQRDRYRERLGFLAAECWAHPGSTPRGRPGGFYLWVPVPAAFAGGGWGLTERLAREGGLLVSPGEFYGAGGAGYVRIAVVQPMDGSSWWPSGWPGSTSPSGEADGRATPVAVSATGSGPRGPRAPTTKFWAMADLQAQIEALWARASELTPADGDALAVVTEAVDLLDTGQARVAEVDPATDQVVVHQWLKQAILLLFRLRSIETTEAGPFEYADKLPLKQHYAAVGGAGGARRLGPVGLVPRPRGHLHAQLRQHRGPGGGRDHGRHLGHRGLVRPDRRAGPPVGGRGHRRRPRAGPGRPGGRSRTR